jgi:16S rRNA processing protein RimM
VAREDLPEAGANEFYWADLVGLKVTNEAGEDLGTVSRVFETGANDVLVVMRGPEANERERLIPGSRQHAPVLPCMEASQQFSTVDRAGRAGVSGIHEADGAAPIQPPHQRDLSAA